MRSLIEIARAERRNTFVLARYWVFVVLAGINALAIYIGHAAAHAAYSSVSATVGFPAPRNILSFIAIFYLGIFLVGIVFLAFEIRARDTRSNMTEILDSRPYSNFQLILGRFLGLLLCAVIPIAVVLILIQVIGWLLPSLGSPIGGTMSWLSIYTFVVYMALPAIAFSISLVILLTLLVRARIAALILSLVVIGGLIFVSGAQNYDVALALDLIGTRQVNQPSQWLNEIAPWFWWIQRIGVLLIAMSFICFAVVVHPRLDVAGRKKPLLFAIVFAFAGIGSIATSLSTQRAENNQLDHWRIAHEAVSDAVAFEIVSLVGDVTIEPGHLIEAELTLTLSRRGQNPNSTMVFSLNPGFNVSRVRTSEGSELPFEHADGLLSITTESSQFTNDLTVIKLAFIGKPDVRFGYLDSAIEIRNMVPTVDRLAHLDLQNGIFESRYVALTPGIHWLPTPGSDLGRDDGSLYTRDFFDLDLSVSVPKSWTVAGPGKREVISGQDDQAVFRFTPQNVVSQVGLFAAPFDVYTTRIAGIDVEVLLNPKHTEVLKSIERGDREIREWVEDKIELNSAAGLEFPYSVFRLVEVPNTLRGHVGGWRMDSALAPPAMLLLREKGLPTARFDIGLGTDLETLLFGGDDKDEQGDRGSLMRDRLIRYFNNDFSGGNLFAALSKSYLNYQTAATGKEAVALEYFLNELTTLVIGGGRSYFSIESAIELDESLDEFLDSDQDQHKTVGQKVIDSFTSKSSVWESTEEQRLDEFDPWQRPTTSHDVLALKSGKLAEIVFEVLGPQKSGELLSTIIEQHRGGSYSLDDVVAASEALDEGLAPILKTWFVTTGLAGFMTQNLQVFQLSESASGDRQYQLMLQIRNAEEATGYSRLSWITEEGGVRTYSAPIRVTGKSIVEFGALLSRPPLSVYLEPYLSLNRDEFLVDRLSSSNVPRRDTPVFEGVRAVAWSEQDKDRIFVDDLDEGFTIVSSGSGEEIRSSGLGDADIDGGLIVSDRLESQWSRQTTATAFGRYRHTLAAVRSGDGKALARLQATLPATGKWRLEIHMPDVNKDADKGIWDLSINTGQDSESVNFNAGESKLGWNVVGSFDLSARDVVVELSNKSTGGVVMADAIAWSPE